MTEPTPPQRPAWFPAEQWPELTEAERRKYAQDEIELQRSRVRNQEVAELNRQGREAWDNRTPEEREALDRRTRDRRAGIFDVTYDDLSLPRQELRIRATVEWPGFPDDPPRVVSIEGIERPNGQPLGHTDEITLRLKWLAVAIALEASEQGFRVGDGGSFEFAADRDEHGNLHFGDGTEAVAAAARAHDRDSFRWTEAIDRALLHMWRHVVEHRCMTTPELAEKFGTTDSRLRTHLSDLRKKHPEWDIPKGVGGKRPDEKDDDHGTT